MIWKSVHISHFTATPEGLRSWEVVLQYYLFDCADRQVCSRDYATAFKISTF